MALPRIIYPSVGVPSGSTSVASRRKGAAEPIGRLKNYIARLLFAAMLAVSSQAFATPTNLGFELGNLTGWTALGDVAVVSSYTSALGFFNNGLSLTPPDIFPPPGEGSFFARLDNLHAICDFTDCGSNPPGTRTNAPVNTAAFSTGSLIGTRGAILSLDPITLLAGQKVPFNWRFLSGFESNTSAFNDFAVFDVVGPSSERIVLADLDTVFNTVGAFGDTGWHEMFWTAPANGTYNLRWVVSDGDNFNDVPSDERYPSTLLIDTVPEPSSFLLFGFGLVGFAWRFSGRNDSQQRATLSPC